MASGDRDAIDNLILLCPNHHTEVDKLCPDDWPAEKLQQLKLDHETRCEKSDWASEAELTAFALLLLRQDAPQTPVAVPPRLEVRHGDGQSFDVVNVGEVDAYEVEFQVDPETREGNVIRVEDGPVNRLSPGAKFSAGIYAPTFGDSRTPVLIVTWRDRDGNAYDGSFPL